MIVTQNGSNLQEQERIHFDSLYASSDIGSPIPRHILPKQEWSLWTRYVGALAGKRVLECGSGDGRNAVWLASQGAFVFAVDISPVGVERTLERARFHGLQDRVRAYCADCCNLEQVVAPNSIDIGLGFSVLHHLPPREFGRSLASVLKPEAHAVFFENSNANPFYRLARRICSNESACGSPLTDEEVETLIAEVGAGGKVYPRFGLFGLTKKYVFRSSRLFAAFVDSVDRIIDVIPGSRQWSAHMWVVVRKIAGQ